MNQPTTKWWRIAVIATLMAMALAACTSAEEEPTTTTVAGEEAPTTTQAEETPPTTADEPEEVPGDGPTAGGTVVAGLNGNPATLDPARGAGNSVNTVGYAIYDTLMTVERLGEEPQPNIAESMEPNDDFTVWTMTLPSGVNFSDGTPFNAEAVKYNIDRHINPEVGSTAAALMSPVESVEAPDETTVVFNLRFPFAAFPTLLSWDGSSTAGFIASPAALEEHGDDYSAHAAGVGPFMLESWSVDGDVVVVRNPEYWNRDKEIYLDGITFRSITDEQGMYQAVQAGDVDVAWVTEPSILADASTNDRVEVALAVGIGHESISLNMMVPPFDDIRARQALSMAINRDELVSLVTEDLAQPAYGLFPTTHPFANDAANPSYDLEGARALVEEYETETGQPLAFTYKCISAIRATDAIERYLTEAGMQVSVEIVEGAARLPMFLESDYQATCWTMASFLTPDALPYRFFHSNGDLNTMGWESDAFDNAADAARQASSFDEQRALWGEADEAIATELPWVWTTTQPIGWVYTPGVNSIDLDDPARLRHLIPRFDNMWLSE